MKKIAVFLLSAFLTTSTQAFKIESSRVIAGTQLITLNVTEERELHGDIEAQCSLYDRRNRIIDTVHTIFDKPAITLRLNNFRWAERVDCTLSS